MSVFASSYANHYDAMYSDKDYKTECDLVVAAATQHGAREIREPLLRRRGADQHVVRRRVRRRRCRNTRGRRRGGIDEHERIRTRSRE